VCERERERESETLRPSTPRLIAGTTDPAPAFIIQIERKRDRGRERESEGEGEREKEREREGKRERLRERARARERERGRGRERVRGGVKSLQLFPPGTVSTANGGHHRPCARFHHSARVPPWRQPRGK
jgi:hypothetical protein